MYFHMHTYIVGFAPKAALQTALSRRTSFSAVTQAQHIVICASNSVTDTLLTRILVGLARVSRRYFAEVRVKAALIGGITRDSG